MDLAETAISTINDILAAEVNFTDQEWLRFRLAMMFWGSDYEQVDPDAGDSIPLRMNDASRAQLVTVRCK